MCLWCDENPYEVEEAQLYMEELCEPPLARTRLLLQVFFFHEAVMLESYHKLWSEDVIPDLKNRGHLKKAIS